MQENFKTLLEQLKTGKEIFIPNSFFVEFDKDAKGIVIENKTAETIVATIKRRIPESKAKAKIYNELITKHITKTFDLFKIISKIVRKYKDDCALFFKDGKFLIKVTDYFGNINKTFEIGGTE